MYVCKRPLKSSFIFLGPQIFKYLIALTLSVMTQIFNLNSMISEYNILDLFIKRAGDRFLGLPFDFFVP